MNELKNSVSNLNYAGIIAVLLFILSGIMSAFNKVWALGLLCVSGFSFLVTIICLVIIVNQIVKNPKG